MTDDNTNSLARTADGRFAPGNAGGPGRPRGAVGIAAAELDRIAAEAHQDIVKVVIEKARAGDLRATALLWGRIWPLRRSRPIVVDAPPVGQASDTHLARSAVTQAVLDGDIAAEDAGAVLKIIEAERHARTASERDARWEAQRAELRAQFESEEGEESDGE